MNFFTYNMNELPTELYTQVFQYARDDLWKIPCISKQFNEIFGYIKDDIASIIIKKYTRVKHQITYKTFLLVINRYRWVTIDPPGDKYMLDRASQNGHLEVIRLLLADSRVNPSANNNAAIRWASRHGYLEIVRLLESDPRAHLKK